MGATDAGDAGRLPGHQGQQPLHREVEVGQQHGQRRLQAEHARGGLVEGGLLGLLGMGGVVGGDGVDGPVAQPPAQGVHVGLGPQGRVHLVHGVVRGDGGVGEGEVVGGHLGRDGQALALGRGHEGGRAGGGQVQEVHRAAGEAAQGHVPGQHELLGLGRHAPDAEQARPLPFVHVAPRGQGGVLAVLGQDDAQGGAVLHGPAHEPAVLHPVAVVGEQAHAQGGHLGQGGQLLALPADGDGAGDAHVARRLGPEAQDLPHHGGAVDGGIGVGHGHHRRVAAQGRGPGPALHRLGLLHARLAQVGVQVDEPGSHDAAPGVEDGDARPGVQPGLDGDDVALAHGDGPARQGGWEQGGGRHQGHLGAQGREGEHVGAGHPAVGHVSHDGDAQAGEHLLHVGGGSGPGLADGVAVEKSLRGVLVPAVACVDHGRVGPARHLPGNARGAVPHHDGVDAHGRDGLDRVPQRLALLHRRRRSREGHGVGREALGRGLEGEPGPGGVLEEEGDDGLAPQGGDPGDGPLADLDERVRHAQHLGDAVGAQVGHGQQVPEGAGRPFLPGLRALPSSGHGPHRAITSPRTTPSAVTSTSSSRRVGRFLPT